MSNFTDFAGLSLKVPYPPSVNHYWKRGRNSRLFVSPEGVAFRACLARTVERGIFTPDDRIAMVVSLHAADRRRRDVDNVAKALLDALTHAGVWADDEQVDVLTLRRGSVDPDKAGYALVQACVIQPRQSICLCNLSESFVDHVFRAGCLHNGTQKGRRQAALAGLDGKNISGPTPSPGFRNKGGLVGDWVGRVPPHPRAHSNFQSQR